MNSSSDTQSLSVLVVDDDQTTRMLAQRALEKAGFRVLLAADGQQALECVARGPETIGVIVLDVLLPDLGGFQVLESLKRDDRLRDIPVVLLTAQANDESDVVRGIEEGADDHVAKPFRDRVLSAKVRALSDRRRERLEMSRRLEAAEQLAATDPLTTLGNRRAFEAQLLVEVAFAKRHEQPLALLVFDIDRFKVINDRHGHPQGDRVLFYVSECIRGSLRVSDQAFRLGGEEFAVLLRDCGLPGAQITACRVLRAVSSEAFEFETGATETVTLSGGVAVMDDDNDYDEVRLLARADAALYDAKAAGRACVRLEQSRSSEPGAASGETSADGSRLSRAN